MENYTKKQKAIIERQKKLSELLPNAISCEFISSVNRTLENGFEVKVINVNHKGYAYYIAAYKNGKERIYTSSNYLLIDNVKVYYIDIITINDVKKELGLSGEQIADLFGYKNYLSYRNSSAKNRIENGICSFYAFVKKQSAEGKNFK